MLNSHGAGLRQIILDSLVLISMSPITHRANTSLTQVSIIHSSDAVLDFKPSLIIPRYRFKGSSVSMRGTVNHPLSGFEVHPCDIWARFTSPSTFTTRHHAVQCVCVCARLQVAPNAFVSGKDFL